ncbi:unnamed protein product [Spirodela intermedia]|uniref:Tf2-1-like SH3-like domain-containing protein n=1 Tax=Spirodela intermedia TaxID=51605 RepID=A0A7I8ICP3_SPIIN|nr:unnamed protein product [Spirodela intermedia]CAA6655588.1 unnamed protein product [Spirodela intermedia]
MDFIESLPKSHGSNAILVVEVAQLFIKEIARLHGFPKTVVSDKGRIFLTVYGKDLPKLIKYGTSSSPLDAINQLLTERDVILKILKFNLHKAPVKMKFNTDKHRREVELEVGDLLNPRYFGPYLIMERIGPVAYKVQLPNRSAVHPVFHISQLRKTLRKDNRSQPIPPTLSEEQEWILIPNGIKAHRSIPQDTEILVSWKHLPEFESSWMTISAFLRQFPTSHLVDKVKLMGGVMLRRQPSSTQDDIDPHVDGGPQQNKVLRPINIEEAEIRRGGGENREWRGRSVPREVRFGLSCS